jgi:hypothetical protein
MKESKLNHVLGYKDGGGDKTSTDQGGGGGMRIGVRDERDGRRRTESSPSRGGTGTDWQSMSITSCSRTVPENNSGRVGVGDEICDQKLIKRGNNLHQGVLHGGVQDQAGDGDHGEVGQVHAIRVQGKRLPSIMCGSMKRQFYLERKHKYEQVQCY